MYDAIVVGARCAGSPTAMLLARSGLRTLLVDRAAFPSDKALSTHLVWHQGVARLDRWGLLDAVRASGAPAIRKVTVDFGPVAVAGCPFPLGDVREGYCPRRAILDHILVEGATRAGAQLRERFTVTGLEVEGGAVVGIRGHDNGSGREVVERARVVVGADGLRSLVAAGVGAPAYEEQPALTSTYFAYFSGVPVDGAHLWVRERRLAITFPTNDGLTVVGLQWPAAEAAAFRTDIEGNFRATLEIAGPFAERLRAGRRESRFIGTADLPFFLRKPYGPGWALVGDAGCHVDPNIGPGISNAFRDAELLASALARGLGGAGSLQDELAAYERARNAAALPGYRLGIELARLAPPDQSAGALMAALSGDPEEAARWLGTLFDTVPVEEFHAPENIARILERAVSRGAA